MIVGIGVDIVDLDRFAATVARTPGVATRVLTDTERAQPPASQAGSFAAKEAVAKAMAVPAGLRWHDCEVRREPDGRPVLVVTGTVARAAADRGIDRWHLSLSHDAGAVVAMVVAESST